MYKKGELMVGECSMDAREEGGYDREENKILAFLPHSCDEWIIGNKENIEILIEDLKEEDVTKDIKVYRVTDNNIDDIRKEIQRELFF